MGITMHRSPYRNGEEVVIARIREHRVEIDKLRAISPVRRAVLPPATLHELDAMSTRVDAALERASGHDVVVRLDELAPRLSALLARTDAEVERMRARPREFPLPLPPKPFPVGLHRVTFSVEPTFRAQFRDAKSVRKHGVGMLAEIEHEGTRLAFVARGRASDHPVFPARRVECMLRTSAPTGPGLTVEPRSLFRHLFPSRTEVTVAPDFDREFVLDGRAPVARALLDGRIRRHLLEMRGELRMLYVGNGLIDLAWTAPFPRDGNVVFLPDAALATVTSIARRLYAA
jgi:hypothetical protein